MRVSDFRVEGLTGTTRVCALVDGERLWYTCDDVDLVASPEAFGSWLLLPSMHRGQPLHIEEPVSLRWRDNAAKLSNIWSEWWNYRPAEIDVPTRPDGNPATSDYALAFSCGVDSFHALLTGPKPDLLVTVQGFDVSLSDEFRMMAFRSSVDAVAAEMGIRWTTVRTNLREHHSAGKPWLWERSHGGGLASVAHMFGDRIGRFGIASTYSDGNQHAWGSAIVTDPLFSSDRVSIEHVGATDRREQKLRLLAHNPLAQRHLRVCWVNSAHSGNCSRCGKCLATMLLLAELGALDSFPVFAGTSSLHEALDALPNLKTQINIIDRLVHRAHLPSNINDAARRLVARSRKAAKFRKVRRFANRPMFDD